MASKEKGFRKQGKGRGREMVETKRRGKALVVKDEGRRGVGEGRREDEEDRGEREMGVGWGG